MKRLRKFLAALLLSAGLIGLTALPAVAQPNYYTQQGKDFGNGCRIVWTQSHSTANGGYITSFVRNAYNYPQVCWLQMKVSYWNWAGTWYLWSSAWIGATPQNGYFPSVDFQYGPTPAIWWTDYNTNWGGNIQGFRVYGQGCNAAGCS